VFELKYEIIAMNILRLDTKKAVNYDGSLLVC